MSLAANTHRPRPDGWPDELLARLECLSLDQQRVLWLRFGDGLEVACIAKLLGLGERTIELLQLSALRELHRVWQVDGQTRS
jgi:DNA-directed RNA polymerase specialized sigma24 family protein